jgi:hypothetical protein
VVAGVGLGVIEQHGARAHLVVVELGADGWQPASREPMKENNGGEQSLPLCCGRQLGLTDGGTARGCRGGGSGQLGQQREGVVVAGDGEASGKSRWKGESNGRR